ncbi:uncharacterized protein LOC119145794 [Falco rusticolus]|uniref:uncharacterized protein LOC119145794 n=1 Tax=Falco rusticolus TaxID=120794 RepID=UPI000FFBC5E4|nr:uncharacterized protein LOC119145794 [Falco rusticolus]
MVVVWLDGWESGSLKHRCGSAVQHLLTFRRWSHPTDFTGTTRVLNTAARAEGICWIAALHQCRTVLGTANASSWCGSRLPRVPRASARLAMRGRGRSPRFIKEGAQPSPKADPTWLCCLLPAHACSSCSLFSARHSNACASQHMRAVSAQDEMEPLLQGLGNTAWSHCFHPGKDGAQLVCCAGASAAAAVSVRLCSRRSGTCRAALCPGMGGSLQLSVWSYLWWQLAEVVCKVGKRVSYLHQPPRTTPQGGKTHPSLNTTMGRCRQDILMGQNKREGEGPVHAMPRPILPRRALALPAHADTPQPACSMPPWAHTLAGITRGLAESCLPEIKRE